MQRPDIVICNEERKIVLLLKLTLPRESNLHAAEEKKELRCENPPSVRSKGGLQVIVILVKGQEAISIEIY